MYIYICIDKQKAIEYGSNSAHFTHVSTSVYFKGTACMIKVNQNWSHISIK